MATTQRTDRLTFPNGRGEELAGRLEWPDGEPRAFALFAHCFTCSKNVTAATGIARGLAARGIAVLRFDFTGLGNSDGDFANTTFASNVQDLVAAARFVETEYSAPQLLVGHSLGGAAVLLAAHELPSVRAVATIGAPSEPNHVKNLIEPVILELRKHGEAQVELAGRTFRIKEEFVDDLDRHGLRGGLGDLRAALMVMHSPIDEVVGIEHARELFDAARHPKSFVSLDSADHLLTRRRDSRFVADVLAAWASRYLDEPDGASSEDAELPHGTVEVTEAVGLRQRVRIGRHELVADEPASSGGTDAGPDPYGFLLASLGACTSMTLRMYARHKGLPLEGISVRLEHDRVHARDCEDCTSTDGQVDRIRRELTLDGPLDAAQRQRLVEIADRCPVHRTLSANEVRVTTILASVD
ncbi:bifunctional alpha/beta hydrolase/OsmC family protein [Engelhardtia mirabilis]|uniref:OsmC-like protein n=1 Tax=Engelhardtia mirabilis TaxID=2528011 RepID=A0A518BHI4_9BACT|nr:OsmC-like protein [Planctomycetes bacterium Pla133]QDV00767.1 OsmC-like protein [Planctomycetes bacterium Pla86]